MPEKETAQEPEVQVVTRNSWVGIFGLTLAIAVGASGFVFLYLQNEIVTLNKSIVDVSTDLGLLQISLLAGNQGGTEVADKTEEKATEDVKEEVVIPEGFSRYRHESAKGDKDFALLYPDGWELDATSDSALITFTNEESSIFINQQSVSYQVCTYPDDEEAKEGEELPALSFGNYEELLLGETSWRYAAQEGGDVVNICQKSGDNYLSVTGFGSITIDIDPALEDEVIEILKSMESV